MKLTTSVLVFAVSVAWMSYGRCGKTKKVPGDINMDQDIPDFMKRTYGKWSSNDDCTYVRFKSLPVKMKQIKRHTAYRMRVQLAKDEFHFLRADLRVEIYGTSNNTLLQNYTIAAAVHTSSLATGSSTLISSPPFVNKDLVELAFDVTNLYNATKNSGSSILRFRFRLLRQKRTGLFRRRSLKAYVIVHEKLYSCFSESVFKLNERFKRSLDMPGLKTSLHRPDLHDSCRLVDYPVDFAKMNWDFVITPSGFNPFVCGGSCNHKSDRISYWTILSHYNKINEVKQSCPCMPVEYEPLTMIYIDLYDNRPVIAKVSDMKVKRCGCL